MCPEGNPPHARLVQLNFSCHGRSQPSNVNCFVILLPKIRNGIPKINAQLVCRNSSSCAKKARLPNATNGIDKPNRAALFVMLSTIKISLHRLVNHASSNIKRKHPGKNFKGIKANKIIVQIKNIFKNISKNIRLFIFPCLHSSIANFFVSKTFFGTIPLYHSFYFAHAYKKEK